MMLNSEELTIALFTEECTTTFEGASNTCNVPHPYNLAIDEDKPKYNITQNITYEIAYLFN